MAKNTRGKKPAGKEEEHRPMYFGVESVTVCVAFCRNHDKRVGEETTDRAKAQADADAHVAANPGHKVILLCSK